MITHGVSLGAQTEYSADALGQKAFWLTGDFMICTGKIFISSSELADLLPLNIYYCEKYDNADIRLSFGWFKFVHPAFTGSVTEMLTSEQQPRVNCQRWLKDNCIEIAVQELLTKRVTGMYVYIAGCSYMWPYAQCQHWPGADNNVQKKRISKENHCTQVQEVCVKPSYLAAEPWARRQCSIQRDR